MFCIICIIHIIMKCLDMQYPYAYAYADIHKHDAKTG